MDIVVGQGEGAKPVSIAVPVGFGCRLAVPFTERSDSQYIAPLAALGHEIRKRFPHWWNDEIVRDKQGNSFSRRDLVLHVADTDGGAHVDPALEARYMAFSRKNSVGWQFRPDGAEWRAIPRAHVACIRQITHEVLMTLSREAPWAFKVPYEFPNPIVNREGFTVGSLNLEVVKAVVGQPPRKKT
jgi:hypothetical protein